MIESIMELLQEVYVAGATGQEIYYEDVVDDILDLAFPGEGETND